MTGLWASSLVSAVLHATPKQREGSKGMVLLGLSGLVKAVQNVSGL